MENRWFPPKGDFHIWLLSKWRILLKQHDQRNLFLRYPLSSVHSRFENEAYVSTENSRFTNDPRSITSLLHGTSHQLSPEVEGGGWGEEESEEKEGAQVGGFWGWMACFSGESGKLYSEITKFSDSPHPPFPSGNKQDRFFNRKLWCVHRPLLYGISETFPYSTIFICLFQCECASIKWLVLV